MLKHVQDLLLHTGIYVLYVYENICVMHVMALHVVASCAGLKSKQSTTRATLHSLVRD